MFQCKLGHIWQRFFSLNLMTLLYILTLLIAVNDAEVFFAANFFPAPALKTCFDRFMGVSEFYGEANIVLVIS